jgi:ssRNA-specific RNase YbeY (16S rRNA maturation enzyme)
MTKKLIIFGAGQIAELAHYYFTHDSAYDVVAFCIDEDYKTQETFRLLMRTLTACEKKNTSKPKSKAIRWRPMLVLRLLS